MELSLLENFDPLTCISGKMSRLTRRTAGIFRKHLKPYGITSSQLSLLFILSKQTKGLTQTQISDIAILEKSSLNRNLQRLFEMKYLSRSEFPLITITSKGKVFVNEIIPAWENAMSEIRRLLGNDGEEALNKVYSKLINKKT